MAAKTDSTTERHDEPTPNGGVASVIYYLDGERNAAPKSRAVAAVVVELDAGGNEVYRTHARLAR